MRETLDPKAPRPKKGLDKAPHMPADPIRDVDLPGDERRTSLEHRAFARPVAWLETGHRRG